MKKEKEKQELDPNFKFKVIDPEAILSLEMSTPFYIRLKQALIYFLKDKTKEDIQLGNEQIKENKVTDEWVIHLETMYVLLAEFDKQAVKANKIIEKTQEEMENDIKKIANQK
jgi:hypothetical protein